MSNKALLIKGPSAIDADLLVYNEMRIKFKAKDDKKHIIGYAPTDTNVRITSGTGSVFIDSNRNIYLTASANMEIEVSIAPFYNITGIVTYYFGTFEGFQTIFGNGLSSLKDCVKLASLGLSSTSVTGDISSLKDCVKLTDIQLDNTSVTGDISSLKDCVKLTDIQLGNTSVTGDISSLKDCGDNNWYRFNNTKVTGDLSQLTKVNKLTGGQISLAWSSSTARSSVTNIPMQITTMNTNDPTDFGSDLDNMLIDQAACTNYSGNTYGKTIFAQGKRTSASDAAIETLTNNGWTLNIINNS